MLVHNKIQAVYVYKAYKLLIKLYIIISLIDFTTSL